MALLVTDEAPSEDEPVYLSIRRVIAERIERGDYPAGLALPSENELADEFGCTRLTVRNAVGELVDRGLVRRIQGKGAFVVSLWDGAEAAGMGFREMIRAHDAEPSVRILSRSRRLAGPLFSDLFGVAPEDELYCVRRLNSVDGVPISIESALIPLSLFPDIEGVDVAVFSLYETYAMYGHEVVGTQEVLGLTELSARDAGLFRVWAGDPALTLDCVSYDGEGRAVEYVRALNLGDRGGYVYTY